MTMNRLYGWQAFFYFLHSANVGLAHVINMTVITILVISAVGAFQLYVSHLGIRFDPNAEEKKL